MAGDRGQVGAGKRASFDRKELVDLAQVPSGSLVEVELQVTSKNRYEYLLIRGSESRFDGACRNAKWL